MSDSPDNNTPEEDTEGTEETSGDGYSAEELDQLREKAGDGPILDGDGRNVFTAEQLAELQSGSSGGVMKDSQGREVHTKEQLAAMNKG